jgi:DNA repair protein REV1
LPNESQLDPEILKALPEDVRRELLAVYRMDTARSKHGGRSQLLLPQSPRKQKTAFSRNKGTTTPPKKQKGLGMINKSKPKPKGVEVPTLTQSNFVAIRNAKPSANQDSGASGVDDEISESFLSELPEDIRAEILAEQRRNRIKAKSGLDVGTKQRKPRANEVLADETPVGGERRLRLQPPPAKPTFTSRKLSTLPELREAMTAWVDEFSGDNEEGPFEEDVNALASYLEKVITGELNLEKAVSVVDWLSFVVSEKDMPEGTLRTSWFDAVDRLRQDVQREVARRKMPPVFFNTV